MENQSALKISLNKTRSKEEYWIKLPEEKKSLDKVLQEIAKTEWGWDLIDNSKPNIRLKSGHMLIYENRLIQPWEIMTTYVDEGKDLKIILVVPGG